MEENIAWIQALSRNKDLAEDKIATIDNEIMDINLDSLFLDSNSHAEISCIDFWACNQATQNQREDSVGLIYGYLFVGETENGSTWICYQEVFYKYHRKY